MALERQVVNTETGEIRSRVSLGDNENFVMLFRNQMDSLVEIQRKDAKASIIFTFILQHMDKENSLIVSIDALSEALDMSVATVNRKIKFLKDNNFICTLRTGGSSIYYVNSNIAWTTYANKREFAFFRSNVVISKTEQQKRKMKVSHYKEVAVKQAKPH
jgi:DNA-binding transcriptional regulator YhcF (GntR family)